MKEILKRYAKRYFIDAMSAMALGLFASLLIGTIMGTLGLIPGLSVLSTVGKGAQAVSGAVMAVAIATSLGADPLVIYTTAAVGYLANANGGAGGPLAVLLIAIAASEIGMLVSKRTRVDILVTPLVTLLTGGILSVFCAPFIGGLVGYLSDFIGWATTQQPLLMGILVSVVIGMALTLPISSAAICASLYLSGLPAFTAAGELIARDYAGLALAGGAAVAGCCAQMVGFAVISFKENKWGGLLSQGIGTSMLQMSNIIKNPRIWIPATLASAVTGPLATCVFGLRMYGAAINSGMGTCGLLGPLGIILGWFGGSYPASVTLLDWVGLILVCFLLPALLSYLFYKILYRIHWIHDGDLTLQK